MPTGLKGEPQESWSNDDHVMFIYRSEDGKTTNIFDKDLDVNLITQPLLEDKTFAKNLKK